MIDRIDKHLFLRIDALINKDLFICLFSNNHNVINTYSSDKGSEHTKVHMEKVIEIADYLVRRYFLPTTAVVVYFFGDIQDDHDGISRYKVFNDRLNRCGKSCMLPLRKTDQILKTLQEDECSFSRVLL